MSGRDGGCCIARYSGNGGGGQISYGMSKVDKIMLKFRPIAPKPMASGSGSSSSTVDHNVGNRRRKRKYVRVNGNKSKKETKTVSKKRNLSSSSCSVSGGGDAVVTTLSLMPETPDRKENSLETTTRDLLNHNKPQPILLSYNNQQQKISYDHVQGTSSHVQKPEIVSFVTMECVNDTWMNGENELGFVTDHATLMNMEMDTCPSFITDSRDTVVWTNKAYKEMTAGGGGSAAAEVVVKKCNRVTMPVSLLGFTCTVKVTWGSERGTCESSVTAPCDVWRLRSGGGYAWRLDVKAALCLGR